MGQELLSWLENKPRIIKDFVGGKIEYEFIDVSNNNN